MLDSTRQSKQVSLGDANWISRVSRCIDAIGTDKFTTQLVAALRLISDFDYSVSFAYHLKEKPVCLFHTFTATERVVFVDDYLKGPYLLDPFFKACSRQVDTGLYRLQDIAPDRFLQSEYFRSYYNQTGLAEEICYCFYLPNDVAIVISLMRSSDSKRFKAREFRQLEKLTPIVCSLSQQHWQEVADDFGNQSGDHNDPDNHSMIEQMVRDIFSSRITPRESQVVAQVLEGHSSESIANSLGISVGTVRIHRRNIYAKLNISSQQELFSMLFQTIRNART